MPKPTNSTSTPATTLAYGKTWSTAGCSSRRVCVQGQGRDAVGDPSLPAA
jgi:hypothetical protein